MMTELLQDLRYAVRILLKNPVFTAAGVLTLALGIGLNTAVFTVVHATLLRPLPQVERPDELVQVYRSWPGLQYGSVSIPHYQDVRDQSTAFSDIAVHNIMPLSVSIGGSDPELALGSMVSANYFRTLGVQPALGRTFLPEEAEGPGAHPVVVLGHSAWTGRFGADPGVIGRTVNLNGHTYEVVGVAPEGFRGVIQVLEPEFYAPLMMQSELMPNQPGMIDNRGTSFLQSIARLAPGVGVEQARERMAALLTQFAEQYPGEYEDESATLVPQSEVGLMPQFQSAQVGLSTVIMVVVGLLLLVACVNVANLFLARARERQREMGVRLSLGAGRARIVRQLMTESMVFALVSGAAGIALAQLAIEGVARVEIPSPVPVDFGLAINGPVLFFALGVTLVTGLAFGLIPALQASKPETVSALKGAGRGTGGSRASGLLVVGQMAMSLLLLMSAGLFVQNLRDAVTVEKGFDESNLVVASLDPALIGYDEVGTRAFYEVLLQELRAMPEVRHAALGQAVPLGFSSQQRGIEVPGYDPAPDEQMSIDYNVVGPGYFDAMGVRLLEGRPFDSRDDEAGAPVLIINESLANRFFPGESALGKTIGTAGAEREIVGVVETGKYGSLGEAPKGYMYLSHDQLFRADMTVHLRTAGPPTELVQPLRTAIRRLEPEMPVYSLQTMEAHLGLALLPARIGGAALGGFGVLGLLLAAVGIYGVMAYSVARRKREISIRVALGADRGSVLGMVVGQGMRLAGWGVVIGLAAAFGAARLVEGLLYGGSAINPVTFIGLPIALIAVAFLATWLPARRAAGIEPMRILRTD